MKVEAKFILSSDKCDCLNEITEALSLQPIGVQRPKDVQEEECKAYSWWISTGKKEDFTTSDQMETLVKLLEDKTDGINALIKKYHLTPLLDVTVIVEDSMDDLMGLWIPPEVSGFAASVQAEVSMGVYLE